ncbi:MAG: hypothetical protein J6O53_08760 [Eubacterium sp.]|nr:hypothetical protein [Eubacterium sp.]
MEEKKSIFRQESLERAESPEKLDKYIRASRPSTWILIGALLVLVVSVVVWGFVGTIPKVFTAKGVTLPDGNVACYVPPEDVSDALLYCETTVVLPDKSTVSGTVRAISPVPYSTHELSEMHVKDWVIRQVTDGDEGAYLYRVDVELEKQVKEDYLVSVSIITDNIRPILYLFN